MAEVIPISVQSRFSDEVTKTLAGFRTDRDFLSIMAASCKEGRSEEIQESIRVFLLSFNYSLRRLKELSQVSSPAYEARKAILELYIRPLLLPAMDGEKVPSENVILAHHIFETILSEYQASNGVIKLMDPHVILRIFREALKDTGQKDQRVQGNTCNASI